MNQINHNKYCPACGSLLEQYYSVESAAKLIDCSEQFFRNLIRDRRIKFVKFGRLVRIPASEILQLAKEFSSLDVEVKRLLQKF
ncbi:MAG: helix-turn-helix domain-containing protein [Candidatus Marinimicrobia bacterium]|nr:helix-turn-helix domain-containing protein [Candidatus Neomarinimicrobiota bacterium]